MLSVSDINIAVLLFSTPFQTWFVWLALYSWLTKAFSSIRSVSFTYGVAKFNMKRQSFWTGMRKEKRTFILHGVFVHEELYMCFANISDKSIKNQRIILDDGLCIKGADLSEWALLAILNFNIQHCYCTFWVWKWFICIIWCNPSNNPLSSVTIITFLFSQGEEVRWESEAERK